MVGDVLRPDRFMTVIAADTVPTAAAPAYPSQGGGATGDGLFATLFAAATGGDVPIAAPGGSEIPPTPGGGKKRSIELDVATLGAAPMIGPSAVPAAPVAPTTASAAASVPEVEPAPTPFAAGLASDPTAANGKPSAPQQASEVEQPSAQPGAQASTSPDQAAAAQSALALSGATKIIGKSAVEAPTLATPVAPPPPAASGKGGSTAVAAKTGETEGAKSPTEAKKDVAAPQPLPDTRDPDSAIKAVEPAQAQPRADATPPADRTAIPTQTAPAPATPSAQNVQVASQAVAASVAAQVASEIATHAGARKTRFEVRLDPAELGRVDVRLDIAHDGRVATRLIVERAETLDLLRNDARELSRTLEQAGFQLGQGGLSFQLKDGRRELWQASFAPPDGAAAAALADEVSVAPDPYSKMTRARAGGVDMTV